MNGKYLSAAASGTRFSFEWSHVLRAVLLALAALAIVLRLLPRPQSGGIGPVSVNRLAIAVAALCQEQRAGPSILDANPDRAAVAQVFWLQAAAARCLDAPQLAEGYYRQVLTQSGSRVQALRAVAPTHVGLARLAAVLYPDQAESHFWLASALAESGEPALAIPSYLHGLNLRKDDANAWMSLGRLYEADGKIQAAVSAYDQACLFIDRGKNGCPNAARIYMENGLYEVAAERYRTSMRQLPYWPSARLGLARALLAQGRTAEAIPYLLSLAESGDQEAQETLQQLQQDEN